MARLRRELRVRASQLLTVAPCPTPVRRRLGFDLESVDTSMVSVASAPDAALAVGGKKGGGYMFTERQILFSGPCPTVAVVCAKRGEGLE